jgi:hypothetical protein
VIARANYFDGDLLRRDRARPGRPWKEWFHFCVVHPEFDLVVNFNLASDLRPAAAAGARLGRVVALLHAGAWRGGVDVFGSDEVHAEPATTDLDLGGSRLWFDPARAVFHVQVRMRDEPIEVDLEFEARTAPFRHTDVALGDGVLHWAVVPSLRASGTVSLGARRWRVREARAYHDHNWGAWRWGGDFAWTWGFGLPDDPDEDWAVVYNRMTDRRRCVDQDHNLYLWRGDTLSRLLFRDELEATSVGLLRPRAVAKFPPVMSLLCPGNGTDVPRELRVTASAGDERFGFAYRPASVCQVAVPDETALTTTLIHEVAGGFEFTTRDGGVESRHAGRGVFEFLNTNA